MFLPVLSLPPLFIAPQLPSPGGLSPPHHQLTCAVWPWGYVHFSPLAMRRCRVAQKAGGGGMGLIPMGYYEQGIDGGSDDEENSNRQ